MSNPLADLQSRLAQLGIQRDQDAYPPDDDTTTAIQQITDAEARWKRDVNAKPKPFHPLPRSALVASHRDMLPATDLPRSRSEVTHRSTFIGQDKYFSSTPMEHLKPITLREMQCNRVHKGFYLICRTFLSPVRGVAVSLYVEDTQGDPIMIGTYNMPGTFQAGRRQLDAHFPVGTALVVREPWMKMSGAGGAYMMLRVDSPSDIIILTPNAGLLRDLSWKTSSPDRSLLSRRSAGDWKAAGDQYFREKMNVAALMAWTHALNLDPNLTTISLNRAQAYLNLKWYGAALADALHAADIASSEAHLFKAQYRAALAEYGLGLYREAFNRLKLLEGGDDSERKVVIGRCIERLKERDGRFDLLRMCRISTRKGLVPLDTADFISPAIRVAEILERGGGRGIRATRDIKTGELLMVHKPFSAATPENVSPMEPITVMNFATRRSKDASQVALVERTVSRLLACPNDAPGVLNLYAGPKYLPLPSDYNLQPTPSHSIVNPLSWSTDIDIARVEGVVSYNAFSSRPVSPYDPDADNPGDSESRSCILYTSPSLFNHACYSNAHWVCFGTTMIVRALADISTGEEITISYVGGPTAFDRATTLKSFFAGPCDCAMCVEDRRAGASTCASRQAIAAETLVILEMPKAAHTARAREARRILKKLQSTYADGGSSSVPRPILFKTYANAMHAVIDAAGSTEGTGGFREAISLGIESIRAIGFEDVDSELGTAAPSTRFELPLGKRRLGHPSMKDAVVLSLSRIAASFMIIGQEIRAERWYRAAWWAHDAYYGGGQGLFDERFRDAVGNAPKPVNMVYKWL